MLSLVAHRAVAELNAHDRARLDLCARRDALRDGSHGGRACVRCAGNTHDKPRVHDLLVRGRGAVAHDIRHDAFLARFLRAEVENDLCAVGHDRAARGRLVGDGVAAADGAEAEAVRAQALGRRVL